MARRANIINVVPHQDFLLEVTLSDSKHLWLNMKKFLIFPAYKKLAHLGFFLSVKHDHRLIYWDENHDIHIDQVLDFGKEIKNPVLQLEKVGEK